MDFEAFERECARTDKSSQGNVQPLLLALGGCMSQLGKAGNSIKKLVRDGKKSYVGFEPELSEHIGNLLWYIATLARSSGISLSRAADDVIARNSVRWPVDSKQQKLFRDYDFDGRYPPEQRLPRQFFAEFHEEESLVGYRIVKVSANGRVFGDPLDDNSKREDHYRFHDVLHLAHAAVLGWSPVMRKLMGCKRKEDAEHDRVDDGARAADTEEAIVRLVFAAAEPNDYYRNAATVDTSLLRVLTQIVVGLEVAQVQPVDWEQAILIGYRAHDRLVTARGGRVHVDLDERSLRVESL